MKGFLSRVATFINLPNFCNLLSSCVKYHVQQFLLNNYELYRIEYEILKISLDSNETPTENYSTSPDEAKAIFDRYLSAARFFSKLYFVNRFL